jgi:hypothetical protein
MFRSLALLGSIGSAAAGTILWDGRFDDTTATDLAEWSWSNQVGQYQYYIVCLMCLSFGESCRA